MLQNVTYDRSRARPLTSVDETHGSRFVSTFEIVVVIVITALGAICQGSLGIGIGLVAAVPLLAIDPAFGPGPLLFSGQIVGIRHIVAEREHLPVPALKRSFMGLPFGALAGVAILEAMSSRSLTLLVGISLVGASLLLLSGVRIPRSRPVEILAGAAATFCSVTAAIPGPPLVMAHSELEPRAFRALVSSFILAISIVALVLLTATGNFAVHELKLLATMVPGLCLGLLLSRWTRPLLDGNRFFRPLILTLTFLAGCLLIIRQF